MSKRVQTSKDEVLHLFLSRLKNQLGPHIKQVILFGSRARGDHVSDSDYDCMVIVDTISPVLNDTIDEIAGEFLYQYSRVFSVFLVSESRYQEQIHNPFFMNVKKEGISL